MAPSVVVGRILLAADQQLGMKELTIGTGTYLVNWRRVQVDEDGARNIFAVARLGEEGLEGTRVGEVLRLGIRATVSL
jgi:hypothetical protein